MLEKMLRKLTEWRNEKARTEGVDLFRVLPNKTLEELAEKRPQSREDLVTIKGIKEAKFRRYGKELLSILSDEATEKAKTVRTDPDDLNYFRKKSHKAPIAADAERKIYSVSEAWDLINEKLANLGLRVRGEVTSVDIRNSAVYFSIKDQIDASVMNCFIYRYQYDILAVDLIEGSEIMIEGRPEIYKPYGRLSLRVSIIETIGEGALKKEYDALKQKLEDEGMFATAGKKPLGRMPRNIGLITSRDGAAIGDFRSNIGRYGFHIRFFNSSVEGKKAVFDLIDAVRFMKRQKDLEAVVIIRGGGSLESLQAFNNEALIREARMLKVPLICGVGHDKDVSLLALAADYAVSTPTAAAKLLGGLWEGEIGRLENYGRNIILSYEQSLRENRHELDSRAVEIEGGFRDVVGQIEGACDAFVLKSERSNEDSLATARRSLASEWRRYIDGFGRYLYETTVIMDRTDDKLFLSDPRRLLSLGYAIVSAKGKGIRSVDDLHSAELLKITLRDGEAEVSVRSIKKLKK